METHTRIQAFAVVDPSSSVQRTTESQQIPNYDLFSRTSHTDARVRDGVVVPSSHGIKTGSWQLRHHDIRKISSDLLACIPIRLSDMLLRQDSKQPRSVG
jgi:hypothetical protein